MCEQGYRGGGGTWARAIAIDESVTVSMGELTTGTLSFIRLLKYVPRFT